MKQEFNENLNNFLKRYVALNYDRLDDFVAYSKNIQITHTDRRYIRLYFVSNVFEIGGFVFPYFASFSCIYAIPHFKIEQLA